MQPLQRYSYTPNRLPEQSRKKTLLLFGVLLVCCSLFIYQNRGNHDKPDDNPQVESQVAPSPYTAFSDTEWANVGSKVNAIIANYPATQIAVSVRDLVPETQKDYGLDAGFEAASTTKILSAVVALQAVQNNELSLNTSVGTSNLKDQLQKMVNQSDNDAWKAVNDTLTKARLASYAQSLGLGSYASTNNVITAADEAILFGKLFEGDLLNKENTSLILSFMQNTDNDLMIPAVAPKDATLYHKYGLLEDRLHDAAIVEYKNHQFVLTIFTKGTTGQKVDVAARTELIKELAQAVFDGLGASPQPTP